MMFVITVTHDGSIVPVWQSVPISEPKVRPLLKRKLDDVARLGLGMKVAVLQDGVDVTHLFHESRG